MGLLSSITGDGLLGGALGFLGQRSANKANSAQAARSMEFQREMAKNAHQYEVADLKKAGLNPLLSGTGGSGAKASCGAQAVMENATAKGLDAMRLKQEISNMKITERIGHAQLSKTHAEAINEGNKIPETKAAADMWKMLEKEGSSAQWLIKMRQLLKK